MARTPKKQAEDQFTLQLFNTPVADIYKKPVQVSQMLVHKGIMTGYQAKGWNLLLKNAKEQNDTIIASGNVRKPEDTFRIDRITLMEHMGYTSTNRKPFKEALKAMQSLQASWDVLKQDGNNIWESCVLIPYIRIDNEFVYYSFTPQIKPMLFESKIYSQLDLEQQKKLKFDAAIRLYDWVSRYKTNPSNLTAKHEWAFWRHVIYGEIDENSYLTEYKVFKRDKLVPAINEINKETELLLKLIEDREGTRSIKTLQFQILEKPKTVVEDPKCIDVPGDLDLNKELDDLGISKHYVAKLRKAFTKNLILANIIYLKDRLNNSTTNTIKNKGAYLVSACESNYAGYKPTIIEDHVNDSEQNAQDILSQFNRNRTDLAMQMFREMNNSQTYELIESYNSTDISNEAKIPENPEERLNRHMIPFYSWLAIKTWGEPTHQEIIEFTLAMNQK